MDYESGEAKPLEDQDEVRWVTLDEMGTLLQAHWSDTLTRLNATQTKG